MNRVDESLQGKYRSFLKRACRATEARFLAAVRAVGVECVAVAAQVAEVVRAALRREDPPGKGEDWWPAVESRVQTVLEERYLPWRGYLDELFTREHEELVSCARNADLQSHFDPSEAVNDAYTRLRRRLVPAPKERWRDYVFRTVVNSVITSARTESTQRRLVVKRWADYRATATAAAATDHEELWGWLDEFLATEKPANRVIFRLVLVENRDIELVASILELSVAAVRKRRQRIRRRLRRFLKRKNPEYGKGGGQS